MLPSFIRRPLRAVGTAILTPFRFAYETGHWRSSLAQAAQSRNGEPLPWYTYSAIDFLAQRSFEGRRILEFGGGQSTRWWASRAEHVLTVEENEVWCKSLTKNKPPNVDLHYIPVDHATRSVQAVRAVIDQDHGGKFDVIVVDGHLRRELTEIAFEYLSPNGALLLDNAEGYGFYEVTKLRNCRRVDFFGFAPGVSKRHCTALIYVEDCFLLDPLIPIAQIESV